MRASIVVAAAMVSLIASGSSHAQGAVQWRTEDGGNGHWYRAVQSVPPKSPEAWFAWAQSNGCGVASIGSAEEGAIVFSVATQNGEFTLPVLGARRDASNAFRWVDGTPWTYTAWSAGEPNCSCERYLMLYPSGWNDTDSTARAWAIVEYSADCNSDGVVDYGQIVNGSLSDIDADGVPDCCEGGFACCTGDVLIDGQVNGADLGALLAYWGPVTSSPVSRSSDLNADGVVNGADIGVLLAGWGACP